MRKLTWRESVGLTWWLLAAGVLIIFLTISRNEKFVHEGHESAELKK